MTRQTLLQKLERVITEAERSRLYGTIEIEFRGGRPTFLTKKDQEKLDNETENRDESQNYRR